jgi:competence protein ComEC
MRYLLLTTLVLCAYVSTAFGQSVRVSVIDRGQADGIVVRTPNHQWVVIDGGTNKQQADLMEDWGVTTVRLAVISHRHFDHNGGMDNILEDFTIEQFIGNLDDCIGNASDDTVREILQRKNIPQSDPSNQIITVDGVTFTILPNDPTNNDCPDHENNNSVMVRMEYGDFSMLFTGDAEGEERDWLVANHPDLLDVSVLKASHHGADNGVSSTWLTATSPERVVISAGVNANHEHPRPDAVDAYIAEVGQASKVYCTNRHKTVTVYGWEDGRIRTVRMNPIDKPCAFDGTHY